ncbi:GL21363 [Drosophila persimilis]|uniref:GL21363 n=1 Tax=Drosophila persimilis TaxID=7234 RepID=B4HBA3_DROPE|nr:GL21363 [Drosophila persimilis]
MSLKHTRDYDADVDCDGDGDWKAVIGAPKGDDDKFPAVESTRCVWPGHPEPTSSHRHSAGCLAIRALVRALPASLPDALRAGCRMLAFCESFQRVQHPVGVQPPSG